MTDDVAIERAAEYPPARPDVCPCCGSGLTKDDASDPDYREFEYECGASGAGSDGFGLLGWSHPCKHAMPLIERAYALRHKPLRDLLDLPRDVEGRMTTDETKQTGRYGMSLGNGVFTGDWSQEERSIATQQEEKRRPATRGDIDEVLAALAPPGSAITDRVYCNGLEVAAQIVEAWFYSQNGPVMPPLRPCPPAEEIRAIIASVKGGGR